MPLKIMHRVFFPEIGSLSLEIEFYGLCFHEQKVDRFAGYTSGAYAV